MSLPSSKVLLVCQFGQPVRGLSPYGDALLEALGADTALAVQPIDYRAAYPGMLHPAVAGGPPGTGELHWANPASWYRVARMEADIIHIQHWLAPMAVYLAHLVNMGRRAGKRVVVTVHNPEAHEMMRWTRPFEYRLLREANAVVVHDARGAEAVRARLGLHADRIHIIPHGIKVTSSPPPPETDDYTRFGLDPARRYVCIFGNLRGYKGIDILLEAWAKVAVRLSDVDLIIAGRLWSGQRGLGARLAAKLLGTDKDAERLRTALNNPTLVGRLHLYEGFQTDAGINSLLKLSELVVFPYVRFASQSGAACRAAGMGCPVLVTDVGGLPDLAINTRWVVVPGDVDKLASALYEKLAMVGSLKIDRVAQLTRVKSYSWSNIAAAHTTLYRDLI